MRGTEHRAKRTSKPCCNSSSQDFPGGSGGYDWSLSLQGVHDQSPVGELRSYMLGLAAFENKEKKKENPAHPASSSSCPRNLWATSSPSVFQRTWFLVAKEKLLSTNLIPKLLFRTHQISLISFRATEILAKFPSSLLSFSIFIKNIKKPRILKLKDGIKTSHHFNSLKLKMH